MRIDSELFDLGEGKLLLGQEVVDSLRVVRRDVVHLCKVLLLLDY